MVILYDRAYWREAGFSGEVLTTDGAATLFYDASIVRHPPDGTEEVIQPAIVGFIAANKAIAWSSKPESVIFTNCLLFPITRRTRMNL